MKHKQWLLLLLRYPNLTPLRSAQLYHLMWSWHCSNSCDLKIMIKNSKLTATAPAFIAFIPFCLVRLFLPFLSLSFFFFFFFFFSPSASPLPYSVPLSFHVFPTSHLVYYVCWRLFVVTPSDPPSLSFWASALQWLVNVCGALLVCAICQATSARES